MTLVAARGLVKRFGTGAAERRVLGGADLDMAAGELVAVLGRSGSGKSTLLHVIGGMDSPDAGSVEVAGVRLGEQDERGLTEFRRDRVGFVFQFFHLIPELTGEENVDVHGRPEQLVLERGGRAAARPGSPPGWGPYKVVRRTPNASA